MGLFVSILFDNRKGKEWWKTSLISLLQYLRVGINYDEFIKQSRIITPGDGDCVHYFTKKLRRMIGEMRRPTIMCNKVGNETIYWATDSSWSEFAVYRLFNNVI